jgi:hypothetical protein
MLYQLQQTAIWKCGLCPFEGERDILEELYSKIEVMILKMQKHSNTLININW